MDEAYKCNPVRKQNILLMIWNVTKYTRDPIKETTKKL